MWVMLTKKIVCEVSPPKLSIHWAVPWPHDTFQKNLIPVTPEEIEETEETAEWSLVEVEMIGRRKRRKRYLPLVADGCLLNELEQVEHNWQGAMKIIYKGREVRVFPNEFTNVSDENLELYMNESHVLMPGASPAERDLVAGTLDPENKDQRAIYDAALVDGANHAQAIMTALGGDPSQGISNLPPIGWYKAKPEYAAYFCRDYEMEPEDLEYLGIKPGEGKRRTRRSAAR